ncbi:PstC family ABC transporter permease [Pseudothermotoga thermarum]|nr:ABC transporter permease subunit [Pseudothermotoga thermarum]
MKKVKEILLICISALAAVVAAAFLFGIVSMLFSDSLKAIREIGRGLFTFGWFPVWAEPEFGILTMFLNSLALTSWTCLWVWFVGIGIAIYLHMYANSWERSFILRILEYISGIPSVVLGMFGVLVLAKLFLKFGAWTGQNFLNASIMLFVLTIPMMTSLTFQSLEKVPKEIKEGAISLGASDLSVIVMELRYATPGVVAAMLTVLNRIFGETMIVLMVAGGSNMLVRSLIDPIRPLTAVIGSEMGEAGIGSLHYSALFFIGLFLLSVSLFLTITVNFIMRRSEKMLRG